MPLALEIAAAWVKILFPSEIAMEIEKSLDFLQTQMRDVPERHRSMRAIFDHSWQTLSIEEQDALRKLSVFRGGFHRLAAEQVTGALLPVLSSSMNSFADFRLPSDWMFEPIKCIVVVQVDDREFKPIE